ncbi:MAG: energy-coupling factor transporter transmembrane component T [Corynebacterium casei]|uniref:energy-coupling factor transporter transmembrane component T n=1 Tax=Corynebacterium TaxID=1716 RepID=UPI002648E280|nr:energy-coupling factor transporter transmembrane component T [Corynebacterium flavescens]MDN6553360.1 energy-coupling factor transporter transmembrane protein EcfT [Corynebacterium flavescens]
MLDSTRGNLNLDPRTKLLALLVCNALVLGTTSTTLYFVIAGLTALLLFIDTPLRNGCLFSAVFIACVLLSMLPQVWHSGLSALIGLVGFWTARFCVAVGIAAWVLLTTRVTDIVSSFNALHAPRFFVIPMAVMFRFIPQAMDELRGISEALKMRGFRPHYLLTKPVDSVEKILVPMLTSVSRISDELAASALLRGLGAPGRPTSTAKLSFTFSDALGVALTIALVAYYFLATAQ